MASNTEFSTLLQTREYRPDIDGLRAIAIIFVMIFHAFPSVLPGGFVGVDVFFVISGFLITSIIIDDLNCNKFRIVNFYNRRIRRIFPALIIVLTGSSIIASFVLHPNEMRQYGKHVIAGVGFVSNFVSWSESGYFDNAALTKPLLHLWSLAIEEQFYLIWPVMLVLARQAKANIIYLILTIIFLSFACNIFLSSGYEIAAFYFPGSRLWELSLGALLASCVKGSRPKKNIFKVNYLESLGSLDLVKNILSLIGLLLLVLAAVVIDENSTFPGWWVLLPTIGTLLCIQASTQTWVNRYIFANKQLVWVGLISYPLYLWHWVLLSFSRIHFAETPPVNIRLTAIALSVLLAWLTFVIVERPIRFGILKKVQKLQIYLCMVMIFIAIFGMKTYFFTVQELGQAWVGFDQNGVLEQQCRNKVPKFVHPTKQTWCYLQKMSPQGSQVVPPLVVITGDSQAASLSIGLFHEYKDGDIMLMAISNCLHYLWETCGNKIARDMTLTEMGGNRKKIVIIVGAYHNDQNRSNSKMAQFKRETDALLLLIADLAKSKSKLIFVMQPPILPWDPRRCRANTFISSCFQDTDKMKKQQSLYKEFKVLLEPYSNVTIFDPMDVLCDQQHCIFEKNGNILYTDRSHLSLAGSLYVGQKLATLIRQLEADMY